MLVYISSYHVTSVTEVLSDMSYVAFQFKCELEHYLCFSLLFHQHIKTVGNQVVSLRPLITSGQVVYIACLHTCGSLPNFKPKLSQHTVHRKSNFPGFLLIDLMRDCRLVLDEVT